MALPKEEATQFRSAAARINNVAQDRPDRSLAACVLAQKMANPKVGDEMLVKKTVRYMMMFPQAALEFRWHAAGG